jgi:hypothetical protein
MHSTILPLESGESINPYNLALELADRQVIIEATKSWSRAINGWFIKVD